MATKERGTIVTRLRTLRRRLEEAETMRAERLALWEKGRAAGLTTEELAAASGTEPGTIRTALHRRR